MYRLDREGPREPNGSRPVYADWMGGPSLAAVRDCPAPDGKARTARVTGEPDSFFSVPAVMTRGRVRFAGWIGHDESGYVFHSADMESVDAELPTRGRRVAVDPASDWFMRGERFATVVTVGRKWITVRGERSGRTWRTSPDMVTPC